MTTKIAGNALYLELIPNPDLDEETIQKVLGWQAQGGSVKQLILFPAVEIEGEMRPPVAMQRLVSKHSPRAQWNFDRQESRVIPRTPEELKAEFAEVSHSFHYRPKRYENDVWTALGNTAKAESYAYEVQLTLANALIEYYSYWNGEIHKAEPSQAWKIRENKPIVIEFTEDDYKDAYTSQTPQAVIRRINKVRGTLDKFPEKLVKFA